MIEALIEAVEGRTLSIELIAEHHNGLAHRIQRLLALLRHRLEQSRASSQLSLQPWRQLIWRPRAAATGEFPGHRRQ
jgi:hypothetical protein